MKSSLIIIPVENLLEKSIDIAGSASGSVIYVSLSKPADHVREIILENKDTFSNLFFIDCVSHDNKEENVLYVKPTQLEQLDYAIKSFKNQVAGEKLIILDALSTLLIYNSENKVAAFVKKIAGYSQEEEVSVVALTPKTKEELLSKIFNFFEEVEKT